MDQVVQIISELRQAGKTISVAESISAGHLQQMLASVSGSSDVFKGGITAYQPSVKVNVLGLEKALADRTNCVDKLVAHQMAEGALSLFKSDYAIATCGYAEPFPEENILTPFSYYAVAARKKNSGYRMLHEDCVDLSGLNRLDAQRRTALTALNKFQQLLREECR